MMHMRPGDEYFFKYIINENDWIVNDDESKRMDDGGNLNNHVIFELWDDLNDACNNWFHWITIKSKIFYFKINEKVYGS